MAIVFALVYLSNSSTAASEDAQKTAAVSFTYTDDSGLITDGIATAMGGRKAADPEQALQDVKTGTTDAYFAYPAEPATQPVKVYGTDQGIFENGKYDAVAKHLLTASAQAEVGSPQLTAAASGDVKTESQTFKDGQPTGGFGSAVPPLMFLLIFYVSIILLSNQMLNSTLEEKENRVTEMILTTLNPTTLIIGKVIALFMVGLVQILVFLTPIAVGYAFFRDKLAIPDLDLSNLSFEPGTMLVGALLLLGGFTVFTGVLVAIGAIMPTAKDAGTIFGPLMALIFVPFYAISLIISDPRAPIVQIFTYFPLSAPVTALLRNGFGTLSPARVHDHHRRTLHHRIPHPQTRRPPLPVRVHPVLEQTLHRRNLPQEERPGRKVTPAGGVPAARPQGRRTTQSGMGGSAYGKHP